MPAATRGGAPVFLTDEELLRLPSANGRIPEQWPERCTDRVIRRASRRANRSRRIRSVDPSPRIFSRRKMCLWQRSRRHWGIARSRLRCAICVWTWGALRFSPGAAASDCLPGLTTDRIPGISSYIKEKALNISAFKCPGQGLIYENIYKQLKFEYIYNVLKYSILKLYAVKCILSVFSCFAKMRTQCGHESIAVFEYKSYLCEYKMRMYGKSYICFGSRGK